MWILISYLFSQTTTKKNHFFQTALAGWKSFLNQLYEYVVARDSKKHIFIKVH